MTKFKIFILLSLLLLVTQLYAQENTTVSVQTDQFAIGLGFGQDYGGFGTNLAFYPQKNVGIFAGLGYAVVGLGYNAGVKFRLVPQKPAAKVTPYFVAMYGYNAAIKVQDASQFDKLFYGPTVGFGIDYKTFARSKLYYNFGINVPLRGSEVDDYMNDLKTNHNIEFKTGLFPVTIAFGFKYILK